MPTLATSTTSVSALVGHGVILGRAERTPAVGSAGATTRRSTQRGEEPTRGPDQLNGCSRMRVSAGRKRRLMLIDQAGLLAGVHGIEQNRFQQWSQGPVIDRERQSDETGPSARILGASRPPTTPNSSPRAEAAGSTRCSRRGLGFGRLHAIGWWGRETTRMRLGTSVIQLSARTPTACAMASLTLDHLSGGRHILVSVLKFRVRRSSRAGTARFPEAAGPHRNTSTSSARSGRGRRR